MILVIGAARANTSNVEEGAIIKAVHFEFWFLGADDVNTTQFTMIIYKRPANSPAATSTEMLNLQAFENKKNILFSTQGVLAKTSEGTSIPVIREWVKIPKGKQRFGLGDELSVTFHSVGEYRICGLMTYKEYE